MTVGTQWKTWERELGMERPEKVAERLRNQIHEEAADYVAQTQKVSFESSEVIEACRVSLDFLAAMAMPDTFRFSFPVTHKTIWQLLVQREYESWTGGDQFPQLALGIPRGHAKTTLIKLWVLWCVLFTKRKFFLVCASIEQHSINIIADVVRMLDQSNIKVTFGDWKKGAETDTKTMKVFEYRGRKITIFGVGAEGAVRGSNSNNERPDMMIFDDIQTKENADSPIMSKSLESWMIGTAMKAKSPSGCMFAFSGNMFPTPHSILKKLKNNPTWEKFIAGAILVDGTALWPELRSIESLLKEFDNDVAMQHPEIFFSEVLNDVQAGMNTNIDFSKFPAWKWTKEDLPQGKFIVVDPSQGKGLDKDTLGYFEVYDEQLGLRLLVQGNFSPGNLIRQALLFAITNDVKLIAIEAMAYQYTLLFWFEEVCKSLGITGIQCVPLYATNHSKNSRIQAGLMAMQSNEIVLHNNVRAVVMRQIADWSPMRRNNVDDILDVIAYAPKVLVEYSYEIMTRENVALIDSSGAQVQEDNHLF